MVDQEVDQDASDGDVEPEREGPPGNEAVFVETLEEGAAQGDDNERDDDDGEDGVGNENREIDGANPALALEENDLVNAVVVDEIGGQEGAGDNKCGDHEGFVQSDFARTDGGVATSEKDGAGSVERGVESGMREQDGLTFPLDTTKRLQ